MSHVTIADIAADLGLSRVAVSKALNNRSGISAATRKRILDYARKLGYKHPGLQQPSIMRVICLLLVWGEERPSYVGAVTPGFYTSLIWEIERVASSIGLQVMLKSFSGNLSDNLVDNIEADWLLVLGPCPREQLQMLYKSGIPVVLVNDTDPETPISSVMAAEVEAAEAITNRLLISGHRHIAFIGPTGPARSYAYRYLGYQLAMTNHAAPVPILPRSDSSAWFSRNTVYAEMKKQLAAVNWSSTTAYILADARLGEVLCSALRELDANLPASVTLAGFLHMPAAEPNTPHIILSRLRIDVMARAAVGLLQSLAGAQREVPVHVQVMQEIQEPAKD